MSVSDSYSLSVVFPCYNEADNLPPLFNRLDCLASSMPECLIVVVNNGSTDNSAAILEKELGSRNEQFKLVNVSVNKGYGFGILEGLRACNTPLLAWTHADIQTDPMDVKRAYDLYVKKNQKRMMVKGFRQKRRITEAILSWGMAKFASGVFKLNLSEINAQPKLFEKDFFDEIEANAPYDFSLDLYFMVMAKMKGVSIYNFPVVFAKRIAGEAKGGSGSSLMTRLKIIKRSIRYIFELNRNIKISN
jgi:glycosyltransferase involved in cell wall biosynthesis